MVYCDQEIKQDLYHDREDHARSCAHAPCHCPGEASGFVGSVTALLDHIAATHGWPCTVETSTVSSFYVYLHDGMNIIVTPVRATAEFLFVLKVTRVPIGRVVTGFCVHPHPAATAGITLSYHCLSSVGSWRWHNQCSEFKLSCTDLSSALPATDSNECFQLVLPMTIHGEDEGTIRIQAWIGAISASSARSSTSTLVIKPQDEADTQCGLKPN
ncbi:hypothetical protein EJB05_33790, partial [Eragrostis curvula]